MILAVATTVVIFPLVYSMFGIVLIPSALGSYWGQTSAASLSLLVVTLVVGFASNGKIQEQSRMKAVGKMSVLLTAVMVFLVPIIFSVNSYYGVYVKETLQSMFSTVAWTTTDWFAYEQLAIFINVALNVSLTLVVSFIGFYAGSMLRKPKKA